MLGRESSARQNVQLLELGTSFFVDFGGIIMSDASGAKAMGVYGVSIGQAGSVSYFAMFKFFCWGDGPFETSSDNTAWNAVYGTGTVPARRNYLQRVLDHRLRTERRRQNGRSVSHGSALTGSEVYSGKNVHNAQATPFFVADSRPAIAAAPPFA